MAPETNRARVDLDVLGLLLAGLINTFLALGDVGLVLGPGTPALQPDVTARAAWIAENTIRWQGGWLFWFAVTLSFSWSYYALGRHLPTTRPWVALAVGLAVVAAAVDIVGILVNMAILPPLAQSIGADAALIPVFAAMEGFSNALTNVAAFGLYSAAGLLLLPALFATPAYPRWLRWLGAAEWGIAAVATVLLVAAPTAATTPLLISFGLFAPWVWGSAWWLWRGGSTTI